MPPAVIVLHCLICRIDVHALVCPTCRHRIPCPRCTALMLFDTVEGYGCYACGWETFVGSGGAWNEGQGIDVFTPHRAEGQIARTHIPKSGYEKALDR